MLSPLNYFLPYQLRWILADAPFVLGEKARRIGWTYASSFRAVDRRLRLGTNLYFTSADLTAAREFIEYCLRWARVANVVANDVGQCALDETDGTTAFVIRFENGAKIVAGSSNPKFFRSKGGDADGDEYAFHADQQELLKAMHASALVWGHQLRLWSTHNGEESFFNSLLGKARLADANGNAGSTVRAEIHRVTIMDAIDQGLVEKIKGLDSPNLSARQRFLDELRATVPDEDTWNQEYLCQPSTEQTALLPYELIAECESGKLPDESDPWWSDPLQRRADMTHGPLYAGFDVGRKNDRSVLWVLEKAGDVYQTVGIRRLTDMPFTQQENLLNMLLCIKRLKRLCIDSTGIGAMLAERLAQRWGTRAEAIHFTAASKSELALPLVRLFQDKRIRVPADDTVRRDLHSVRRTLTSARNVRLDALRTVDGHGDHFWALALAYHAADDHPAPAFGARSLLAKPVGW